MSLDSLPITQEIQKIEAQLVKLRHQHHQELLVKLAEARHAASLLEKKLAEFEASDKEATDAEVAKGKTKPAKGKRTRVSISIEQVVAAVRKGATNYRAVARELGCSALTVAKKVESEGKAAGIITSGSRATFALRLKK